jgi:glycosyltransferase involved in cell wall biosynthesis
VKILFVSCLLPYPTVTHGGGTDLFHLIDSLGQRHEVHLVSLVSEAEVGHVPEIARYCASVRAVVPAWAWRQKLRNFWGELWTHPLLIGRRAQTAMRAYIRQVVAEHHVDIVQFEWTETGQYLDAVPSGQMVRILDEVDVSFHPLECRAEAESSPMKRAYARWRSRQARHKELVLCHRFDAVLTRSEHDCQLLRAHLHGSCVEVFQPWTHVARFTNIEEHERRKGCLLFVGAMDRDENCEAVLYFYHRVFPRIRLTCPEVELCIVGAQPQSRVKALSQDPAVKVTGYVEDLRDLYAGCDVFVAPIQVAGGVFNKIIDAMGAGRPVVTTSLGNEGVNALPGSAVLLADDPDALADLTIALLKDASLWSRVAEGGRQHVQRVYNWEKNVSQIEALYERLTSSPKRL